MNLKDRLRRRLKGIHIIPNYIEEMQIILNLAVSRPVNLIEMQKIISSISGSPSEVIEKIIQTLSHLQEKKKCEDECNNIIVSTIRAFEISDPDLVIEFGMKVVPDWPEKRAMATLVSVLEREGKQHLALEILEYSDTKWARRKRDAINASIGLTSTGENSFQENVEKSFLNYVGMEYLEQDPAPAILLYGNVDMNVIDGSSVWLSSIVEAFSGTGFEVHVLLKRNIDRDLLVGHLKDFDGVKLFEPHMFGLSDDQLSLSEAVDIMEVLDGMSGGYRAIILRGMTLCVEAGAKKSFCKRIWAYLTDYYYLEEEKGLIIEDDTKLLLNDLQHVFEFFLVQTEELGNNLQDIGINPDLLRILPPMIPNRMTDMDATKGKSSNNVLKIGYCGKIAPMWGVRELIEKAERMTSKERPIEVHVIGDKVHRSSPNHPTFRQDMDKILRESPVVTWHGAVGRDRAVELLAGYDFGWCYRSSWFEKKTLELSTKLLEHLAINLPFVVTRNDINENLLGHEYPFFVDNEDELDILFEKIVNKGIEKIDMKEILTPHLISSVRTNILKPLLVEGFDKRIRPHRVVIAGTDLKFVGQFESHLKKIGCVVRRDVWEWGEPQFIQRTKALMKWADFIWCEWSLANAVWYSNNLKENQQLVSRLHLQEVGQRASKFQYNVKMENVKKIIVVAEHVRLEAIKLFGWEKEKLVFIPNFIESERMKNEHKNTSLKKIGIVGVVPERKRLDLALDLLEELRKKDDEWSLVIKGKLPHDYPWMLATNRKTELKYYDNQYKRIKASKYLGNAVEFEGYTLTMTEFFIKLGYVISPSDFESFHYTIADGVSAGNFPVIWPWEGADELYPREWVINDVKSAAKAMLTHSQLPEKERQKQVEERFEEVRSRYDMEVVFPQLVDVLFN